MRTVPRIHPGHRAHRPAASRLDDDLRTVTEKTLRSAPPRAFRRVRTLAASALGSLGVFAIALSGVGGSYALWNDRSPVGGAITTGTAGLVAAWETGHDDALWSNLLPGESVRQGIVLVNTGDARLALSVASTTGSAGFEVRVEPGACPAGPLPGAALTGVPQQLHSGADPLVLEPSQQIGGCLEVRATASLSPGDEVAFVVQFDGEQAL